MWCCVSRPCQLNRTNPKRFTFSAPFRRVSALLAGLTLLVLTGPAAAQLPSQDFFPIGVFAQPTSLMDRWKSRGINTMFQYESEGGRISMQTWSQAAAQRGLYYARWPSSTPANDLQERYLLAWTQADEPDLENHNPIPANLIDKYQNLNAISPSKPVWVNFAGNHVTMTGANYTQWAKGGDWLSSDWYPFNTNPSRYSIKLIGQAADRLRIDSGGKKIFSIIESSNQKLPGSVGGRAPTRDEFRGEIWEAIVHGATGILYFPQQIGGFQYDATPTAATDPNNNIEAEMISQNAKIQSLARVLNSTYNPAGRSFSSNDSQGRLEATWRTTSGGDYFVVLNTSNTLIPAAQLNLAGLAAGVTSLNVYGESRTEGLTGGIVTDDFAPYAVHIYTTATLPAGLSFDSVADVSLAPEPASLGTLVLAATAMCLRRPRRYHTFHA